MDFNRNHFFMFGMFILLLGIQLRLVDTYVLNEKATQFLAKNAPGVTPAEQAVAAGGGPHVRKVIQPEEWIGWCLLSVGGVLIMHSLALKRPD